MASNNYAEVITDSTEAQRVLAELESMATQGASFRVMQFNPDVDRFAISWLAGVEFSHSARR